MAQNATGRRRRGAKSIAFPVAAVEGGSGYFDGWGHRGGVMGIFGARRIYEA